MCSLLLHIHVIFLRLTSIHTRVIIRLHPRFSVARYQRPHNKRAHCASSIFSRVCGRRTTQFKHKSSGSTLSQGPGQQDRTDPSSRAQSAPCDHGGTPSSLVGCTPPQHCTPHVAPSARGFTSSHSISPIHAVTLLLNTADYFRRYAAPSLKLAGSG